MQSVAKKRYVIWSPGKCPGIFLSADRNAVSRVCSGGSVFRRRGGKEILAEGAGLPLQTKMDGKEVFRFAVRAIPKAAGGALADVGIGMDEVDSIVCQQANARIIDHFAKQSGQPPGKFFKNIDHTGNTSAASIPIALNEMESRGLLHEGE